MSFGKKKNGLENTKIVFHVSQNQYHLFVCIVIASQQLEDHKVIYIMVSLNMYIVDIIPLNTCSRMELFILAI